jgi:large subunit ribosomal protein L22
MFTAMYKGARISARKVRPVADLIRGKFVDDALAILKYQPHRGARFLEAVIKSALGNATDLDQNKGRRVAVGDLIVSDARVDGGPMFKRMRPGGRGMSHLIKKRSSHISVTLEEV